MKTNDFMDYLMENAETVNKTVEIELQGRLKERKFVIKPVAAKDFHKWSQECRTITKKRVFFDEYKFDEQLITKCCVEPNFCDEALITKAGCKTPGDLINKLLRAGEVKDLASAIVRISGFNEDPDDIVEN